MAVKQLARQLERDWWVKVWFFRPDDTGEDYSRSTGPFTAREMAEEFVARLAGHPRFARALIVEGGEA